MELNRRGLIARIAAATSAGALAWHAGSRAVANEASDLPKVVYHLSDVDKVNFVLGNIENHIEGMGGADKVRIALVVHGPALAMFEQSRANPAVTRGLAGIREHGVTLGACGNTMSARKVTLDDLLPGFVAIEEGGVVRIAQLQAQGYAYLRP